MPAVETMPIEKAEAIRKAEAEDGTDEEIDAMRDLHRETAKRIWPRGTTLRCPKCGRIREFSTIELATFLGRGWPVCHGETMRISGLVFSD